MTKNEIIIKFSGLPYLISKKFPERFRQDLISVGNYKLVEMADPEKDNINYYYTGIINAYINMLKHKDLKMVSYWDKDRVQEGFTIQVDLEDYLNVHFSEVEVKVIELFIDSIPYLEIVEKTKVSKSRVYRIIQNFKNKMEEDWVNG